MKAPRKFFEPLAIGAPRPLMEIPARLERMIHFVPPHNDKVRAKVGELATQVDVVLGNLEDAIPIEAKEQAREGFIAMAKANDFGSTGLWVRVNALNSPWFLDDMTRIVAEIGDKLDVVMLPKVEGPWDIHFIDQYLALLEARAVVEEADPRPCDSGDGAGRQQCRGDRRRLAAHARHEPGAGRSRRLARDEDDARRRRPSRLSRALRPDRRRRAAASPPSRIPGIIRSRAWSTPAPRMASRRSTARSAISPIPPPARRSSATPSCSAAPAPGRCIRARSQSPRGCFRPTRRK